MAASEPYVPGTAGKARVERGGEKWTLILVRELRHPPVKVWQALTDPTHLRAWAPFDADENLAEPGPVKLTWVGTGRVTEAKVTRAEPPELLECGDMRWELEAIRGGTRLRLWHNIDRRFIAWGAAGWHICFDVLERLLAGVPIGRMAGPSVNGIDGWQRLCREYARQFEVETPEGQGRGAEKP